MKMELGKHTSSETDVLVIGGGPAGAAAAITAVDYGLDVILVEQAAFPRLRPGETLHPGVEPVFERLGVGKAVDRVTASRPTCVEIKWSGHPCVQPYGADESGPWRGYLISRDDLDGVLLNKAKSCGVDVRQPCHAGAAIRRNGQVIGAETTTGDVHARIVIDAGGSRCWSSRQGIVGRIKLSRHLIARYWSFDLSSVNFGQNPSLTSGSGYWTWLAPMSSQIANCTQLIYPNTRLRDLCYPNALEGLPIVDRMRGADVTWRLTHPAATQGVITVGDAATVHDPLSSHGILHALMSGIMAAKAASSCISGGVSIAWLSKHYDEWTRDRFFGDSANLISLYLQLNQPPAWVFDASKRLVKLK